MPLKVFRPEEEDVITSEGEDVILVSCEPYFILGHAKAAYSEVVDDDRFVKTTLPLNEIYQSLPISSTLRNALASNAGKDSAIWMPKEVSVKNGSYLYLTVCSSQQEDIIQPTEDFIDWKTEKELLKGGLVRSERAIASIEAVDRRRRLALLPLLNDPKTYLPFSGKGHVLGQAGKTLTGKQAPSLKTRDKAVRRFHEALKQYRDVAKSSLPVKIKGTIPAESYPQQENQKGQGPGETVKAKVYSAFTEAVNFLGSVYAETTVMHIYIIPKAAQVSINYHPGGGVVIIAASRAEGAKMAGETLYVNISPDEWEQAIEYEIVDRPDVQPRIVVFPDAGCC
ncbi:hypothetical protein HDV00_007146 [Rhizophlyctis rosea]|nr:hypothetical protein HDV00_007146 [Rhizophlyctis rosea]